MEKHIKSFFQSHLADYVTAIWEVKGSRNVNEIILPQGVIEIVFNFSETITGFLPLDNSPFLAPRCFIQGINTSITRVSYLGQHHLFGIRLQPNRVEALLGIPSSEVTNTNIDLGLIDAQYIGLWHRLADAVSFENRVAIIEEELPVLSGLNNDRPQALSQFFHSAGSEQFANVDQLAREVCYSTRQLNRVSRQLFGLSAEELTTYKKYMEAIQMVHHGNKTLTEIAHTVGFYDQAHFCRVFKNYTGMTAKDYNKNKSDLPFHIFIQ